jgi:hypothetical protein
LVQKSRQPNLASLLKHKAGCEVVWKGKRHLSYAANAALGNSGEDWRSDDIAVMEENYGWSGWNQPDGGNAIERLAHRVRQVRWADDTRWRFCGKRRPPMSMAQPVGPGTDFRIWPERSRFSEESSIKARRAFLSVRVALIRTMFTFI